MKAMPMATSRNATQQKDEGSYRYADLESPFWSDEDFDDDF